MSLEHSYRNSSCCQPVLVSVQLLVTNYVNLLTTPKLYSPNSSLCVICFLFSICLQILYFTLFLRPNFFLSVFRSSKISFVPAKDQPIKFISPVYQNTYTYFYSSLPLCVYMQPSNIMF
jgi:hypothetical protein